MSTSSGIRQDSHTIWGECESADECDFAGWVDEFVDPETYAAWWECPKCHHQHDTATYVFAEDHGV